MRPMTSLTATSASSTPAHFAATEDRWVSLRQRLIRHARMVVHEPALAEDLAQETLVSVLENSELHRGEASITTWAIAILKNKIADWYRSPHQRRRVYISGDDDGADSTEGLFDEQGSYLEPVPVWEQPDGREAQRQIMSTLDGCLRRLPTQTGRVFMMREWLGFETSEICEQLGLTADNCRMILHRARMGLRQCMSAHGQVAGSAA
ncbi:MAG: RNA polymerase subunit sigma [Betaproteobacteria bacterium HGW-Betaproteobacteria-15]|nr:MAG: RNA polymerase subunit sigma [Betaproteobacteria bacterium HGW-Betaproteobacteria-15]